jgi:hypothetical protein
MYTPRKFVKLVLYVCKMYVENCSNQIKIGFSFSLFNAHLLHPRTKLVVRNLTKQKCYQYDFQSLIATNIANEHIFSRLFRYNKQAQGKYSRRGKYSHNFRKTAGTKTEISPLRYIIETSGFFHCTHIYHSNITKKGS